jgi:hypothetical protein
MPRTWSASSASSLPGIEPVADRFDAPKERLADVQISDGKSTGASFPFDSASAHSKSVGHFIESISQSFHSRLANGLAFKGGTKDG